MHTYIRTINFGLRKVAGTQSRKQSDKSEQKDIEVPTPDLDPKRNTLTVVAGRNRTGKSHLLRHTDAAITAHNENLGKTGYLNELGASSANVWVRPKDHNQKFGKCFLLNDVLDVMGKFALFGINANREKKGQYHREIYSAKDAYLAKQLAYAESLENIRHGKSAESFLETWSDEVVRTQIVSSLDAESMYRANSSRCAATKAFETLTSAKLYFRRNDRLQSFEPVLRYGHDESFAFGGRIGGWSQGQKVAFALLILVEYCRPEILLIDELENHLHPEYISKVCQFIKERVPQTIVVTHHPHLIFSAFVDRVWFLDVTTSSEEPPLMEPFPEKETAHRPPPKRKVILLDSDYERIAATYSLFDGYDHQLLNLASALKDQIATAVLKAIESGLTLEVATASSSVRPDTQSRELAEAISSITNSRKDSKLRILDYGAGYGRTQIEMQKTPLFQNRTVEWTFFEPSERNAKSLSQRLASIPENVSRTSVLTTLAELESDTFDIVLIANVLHECSPVQISEALANCRRILSPTGRVLVAELFPLLSPERFGIAYSMDDMHGILRECKYAGFSIPVPIRSGLAMAYTTIATPHAAPPAVEECAERIRTKVWQSIKERTLYEYASSMELANARNAVRLASQLHVIASIEAYDAGLWVAS